MDRNDLRIGDAEREQTMAALRRALARRAAGPTRSSTSASTRRWPPRRPATLAQVTADLPGQETRLP
ncbi:hypothetical protein [Nonomuraea rubra]|uniref:hypothetical protein n=1 Tax=Nonomuraea rubra TaxID=46180 RepID=UPI0031E7C61C